MRGRRPKSDEQKKLAGNPGKRALADAPAGSAAAPGAPEAAFEIPDFLTHAREREIFTRVVRDYLRQRVARRQDLLAYARWAHYLHRWVKCKEQIGEGGTWYETKSKHGDMLRMHPAAKEQLQLERVLQTLEDRLGLNPAARQNLLRGLAALPAPLGGLFDEPQPPAPAPDAEQPVRGAGAPETPLGWLNAAGGKPN